MEPTISGSAMTRNRPSGVRTIIVTTGSDVRSSTMSNETSAASHTWFRGPLNHFFQWRPLTDEMRFRRKSADRVAIMGSQGSAQMAKMHGFAVTWSTTPDLARSAAPAGPVPAPIRSVPAP